MEARVLLVCLFVFAIVRGEEAPAGLCRANERLLMCGCPRTCRDPAPDCKGVCREGCFCEDGQVRNDDGLCVDLAACPPILSAYKEDTTEPRPNGTRCPPNEEYRYCENCNKTCDRPNPVCPAQCFRGCFCKDRLLRDKDGSCVTPDKCSNSIVLPTPNATQEIICGEHQVYKQCEAREKTCYQLNPHPHVSSPCKMGCYCKQGYVKAPNDTCVKQEDCPKGPNTTHEMICGKHKVYKRCEIWEKTCHQPKRDPYPHVISPCMMGCFCAEGYVKAPSGKCVKLEQCPKGNTTVKPVTWHRQPSNQTQLTRTSLGASPSLLQVQLLIDPMVHDAQPSLHDPSVEDCSPDEEYLTCGWCEPSCSNPTPSCPNKVCMRGCLCRSPLLRHHTGRCVDPKDCFPETCSNPNEEFVCLFGCELRCDGKCVQPRYCTLGCYCKIGLLRDTTGLCVLKDKCTNGTEVRIPAVNLKKKRYNDEGLFKPLTWTSLN